MDHKQEQQTVEARLLDSMEILPDLVIEGPGIEASVSLLEIPGSLSSQQIELAKLAIIKTLTFEGAQIPVAIATLLNKPTFGIVPTRIQLPKTSAARLILKFQMGDVNVEPQDGPFIDRFGLPPAFEDFTGREDSLALLEVVGQKTIIGNSEVTDSTKKTVSGTGGIGKTQLAVTFAHSKLKQFQETQGKSGYRSIIWFIAGTDEGIDNQGLMTEQMQRLGTQLGFDPKQLTPQALIKLIFERLEKEHGPYLVVFDNAPNLRSVQSFCPPSSVPVIITTRNFNERDWGQSFTFIPLTVFTDNEAHLYIKKVLCRKHEKFYEENEAKALATALGNFPLALTQALAYITSEDMRITEYLEEFRRQKALYLQEPVPLRDPFNEDKNPVTSEYAARPKEEYDPQKATVWAVIQLSLKKVTNANAHQVLKTCAYFAPEAPIDVKLLAYWSRNITECRESLTALRRYSLVDNVAVAGHVRIHQLVQEILRIINKDSSMPELLEKIVETFSTYYELSESEVTDELRRKRLYPHLKEMLKHLEESEVAENTHSSIPLLYCYIGSVEGSVFLDHKQQCITYEKALSAIELSNNLEFKATLFVDYGVALKCVGRLKESKVYLEKALEIRKEIYGITHYKYAFALYQLGSINLALTQIQSAQSKIERALEIYKKDLSTDSNKSMYAAMIMDLGNTYGELYSLYGELNFLIRSENLYAEALAIYENIYTRPHHSIALAQMNLGIAYRQRNKLDEAKKELLQSRKDFETLFGPDHPQIARVLTNLGDLEKDCNKLENARQYYENALKIDGKSFGPDYPESAFTHINLADTFIALSQKGLALVHFQHSARIFSKHFDDQHPGTVKARAMVLELQQNIRRSSSHTASPTRSPSDQESLLELISRLLEDKFPPPSEELLQLAKRCIDNEFISQALILLKFLLEDLTSISGLLLRADCQLKLCNFSDARETALQCQALAKENDTEVKTLCDKIKSCQQEAKLPQERIVTLKAQTSLSAKDKIRLAADLWRLRRIDEALMVLDSVIADNPSPDLLASAYFLQAQCNFGLQQYEDALNSCDNSARLKGNPQLEYLRKKITLSFEGAPLLNQFLYRLECSSLSRLNI